MISFALSEATSNGATSSEASEKGKETAGSFLELLDANSARDWALIGEQERIAGRENDDERVRAFDSDTGDDAYVPAISRDRRIYRRDAATFRTMRVFKRLATRRAHVRTHLSRSFPTMRNNMKRTRAFLPGRCTHSFLSHATCHRELSARPDRGGSEVCVCLRACACARVPRVAAGPRGLTGVATA